MYTIYSNDAVLYNPLMANDGYVVSKASVDLEIGMAGSISLTVPITNPIYESIHKMRTMIRVVNDGAEIIRGRVLNDTKDFYNNRQMYVEGELAFFIDYIAPPYDITGTVSDFFSWIVGIYNSQVVGVEDTKTLTVGSVTVIGSKEFKNIEYSTLQDALYNELVNEFGGYLRIRVDGGVRYIDYIAEYAHQNTQTIEFGKNIISLSEFISAEDTATVVIPLGAMQKDEDGQDIGRVTIKSIMPNEIEYVNDPVAQTLYGNIWKTIIFDDISDPAELKRLGEKYLSESKNLLTTLEISAVDLSLLDVDIERIAIGDVVRVVSVPHGVDAAMQCCKIHLDLLNPASNTYTFGSPSKQITKMQTATQSDVKAVGAVAKTAQDASQHNTQGIIDVGSIINAFKTKVLCTLNDMEPIQTVNDYALVGDGYAIADNNSCIKIYSVMPTQVVSIQASKDNGGVYQWQNVRATPTSGDLDALVGDPVTIAFNGLVSVPDGAKYLVVSQAKNNDTNHIGVPARGTLM